MPIRKPRPKPKSEIDPVHRMQLLERVAKLASEMCDAIDAQESDVGGHRNAMSIIEEIGPLCDTLEGR